MRVLIEHDPDNGCEECPLLGHWPAVDSDDAAMRSDGHGDCSVPHTGSLVYEPGAMNCAPDWCRLRSGAVTVRRPKR